MKNLEVGYLEDLQTDIVTEMPLEDLEYILKAFNDDFDDLESIGTGSFGYVYGYKEYAIKQFKRSTDAQNNDINSLIDLQHLDCIPTLYAVIEDRVLVMERIKGVTVKEYCIDGKGRDKIHINQYFLDEWDEALLDCVRAGYSPSDLHEKNVMIEEGTNAPKFVDLGWFFKHNCEYNNFDIHKMKTDRGYSTAYEWTGNVLKTYFRRQNEKIKAEADKILEKYNINEEEVVF